jgi:multiple sugar transport system substrate-binding protein
MGNDSVPVTRPSARTTRRALLRGTAQFTAALAVGVLAACGGGSGPATTAATSTSRQLAASAAGSATTAQTTARSATSSAAASAATVATSAASTTPALGGATITLDFPHWGDVTYQTRFQRLADAFEAKSPGIKINVVNWADYSTKIRTTFAGGTPPQTFIADHGLIRGYVLTLHISEDLTPLANQDRTFQRSAISPAAFDDMTVDGKLYGVTGSAFTAGFFYNRDLFDAAGLTSPYELWQQDQWTWDRFLSSAQKLTRVSGTTTQQVGVTGFGLDYLWMDSNGGSEFDDTRRPTVCNYAQPDSVEALDFLYNLDAKYHLTTPSVLKGTGMDADKAFMQGKAAMTTRWTTGLGLYKAIDSFTWGLAPYPKGKRGYASDFTIWSYTVAAGLSERIRQAAWQWMTFLAGEGGQEVDAASLVAVPFTAAAQAVFSKQLKDAAPRLEHPETMGTILTKYPYKRLITVDSSDIEKLVSDNLSPGWKGQMPMQQAATQASAAADAYLKAHLQP